MPIETILPALSIEAPHRCAKFAAGAIAWEYALYPDSGRWRVCKRRPGCRWTATGPVLTGTLARACAKAGRFYARHRGLGSRFVPLCEDFRVGWLAVLAPVQGGCDE